MVFTKVLTPSGFVFLCTIVYTTINDDIADIVNNVKFSKSIFTLWLGDEKGVNLR